MATEAVCNICGGEVFLPGPNGRMSRSGRPPRCAYCGSLERHRRLRGLYHQLPAHFLASLGVLQLSPDLGVDSGWFLSHEVSVFGGENSLDLHSIDRPDACYDLVVCNHVLEHVADDRRGLAELMRVVRPGGFVQLTVPSPYTRAVTVDWGYPRAEAYGHYRGYGRDVICLFRRAVADTKVVEVEATDLVTRTGDYIYLWTRSEALLCRLRDWIRHPMVVV